MLQQARSYICEKMPAELFRSSDPVAPAFIPEASVLAATEATVWVHAQHWCCHEIRSRSSHAADYQIRRRPPKKLLHGLDMLMSLFPVEAHNSKCQLHCIQKRMQTSVAPPDGKVMPLLVFKHQQKQETPDEQETKEQLQKLLKQLQRKQQQQVYARLPAAVDIIELI